MCWFQFLQIHCKQNLLYILYSKIRATKGLLITSEGDMLLQECLHQLPTWQSVFQLQYNCQIMLVIFACISMRQSGNSEPGSRQSGKPEVHVKGKLIDARHAQTHEVTASVFIRKYCPPLNAVLYKLLYSQSKATCKYFLKVRSATEYAYPIRH